jgi:hypothetical protein
MHSTRARIVIQARRLSRFIEDLPDVIPLTKGKKVTRRKQMQLSTHDEGHNSCGMRSPNFQVGDYVLVAEHRKSGVSKLQVK